MPTKEETSALLNLIEKLTKKVEELSTSLEDVKKERTSKPVITSALSGEERKQTELSTPGMQRAIDKVLQDWERTKERD